MPSVMCVITYDIRERKRGAQVQAPHYTFEEEELRFQACANWQPPFPEPPPPTGSDWGRCPQYWARIAEQRLSRRAARPPKRPRTDRKTKKWAWPGWGLPECRCLRKRPSCTAAGSVSSAVRATSSGGGDWTGAFVEKVPLGNNSALGKFPHPEPGFT